MVDDVRAAEAGAGDVEDTELGHPLGLVGVDPPDELVVRLLVERLALAVDIFVRVNREPPLTPIAVLEDDERSGVARVLRLPEAFEQRLLAVGRPGRSGDRRTDTRLHATLRRSELDGVAAETGGL